ncbi:MAG: hypothetical protein M1828_000849 [Chrysothrix sp. TS-e1954]|nr:MAG: hypothetical protein M1828_000849 [Chrysothrix sp. TS-e1954]
MAPIVFYIVLYVGGGLTFLPLLFVLILLHAYLTLPTVEYNASKAHPFGAATEQDKEDRRSLSNPHNYGSNVAAGYFAVCREYVPGGINGKPPERTTPAGQTIVAESPSVYQTIARSIWDRGKTQSPTLEAGRPMKKARNVFFVVLRHGHLVLFDNSDQLEVRHVIALAHFDVDLYAGGERIPEGELFIKRNCIRLEQKESKQESARTLPFFLFSDSCYDKEDFYHALLRSSRPSEDVQAASPEVQFFEADDMIKLIRQIHVADDGPQTRWLNALLGRLFLALYKTSDLQDFVRMKIRKKIARVSKPAFITSLSIEEVDMGHSAPMFTNLKVRDMTVDGELTLEADVKYSGNFKLVIAAVARIELGTRFKPREVSLILAGTFKKLEGHVLFRLKPPPSNRVWISFESMPKLDIVLEPIVSSRQITYGVILRALESKLREVISDTLCMPNWDDVPFKKTESSPYRGGVWKDWERREEPLSQKDEPSQGGDAHHGIDGDHDPPHLSDSKQRTSSMPNLSDSPPIAPRQPVTTPSALSLNSDEGNKTTASQSTSTSADKPKALRSHSFATAASPIISKGPAQVDSVRHRPKTQTKDAASSMKTLSQRSPDSSPVISPSLSPSSFDPTHRKSKSASFGNLAWAPDYDVSTKSAKKPEARFDPGEEDKLDGLKESAINSGTLPSAAIGNSERPTSSKGLSSSERKQAINQTIGSATAAAKNWGWSVLQKRADFKGASHLRTMDATQSAIPSEPVGRGQPLPPPGTPLPRPEKNTWSATALGSLKRKPVPAAVASEVPLGPRKTLYEGSTPRRPHASSASQQHTQRDVQHQTQSEVDLIMRIDAPQDSRPVTPTSEPEVVEDERAFKIDGDAIDTISMSQASTNALPRSQDSRSAIDPPSEPEPQHSE